MLGVIEQVLDGHIQRVVHDVVAPQEVGIVPDLPAQIIHLLLRYVYYGSSTKVLGLSRETLLDQAEVDVFQCARVERERDLVVTETLGLALI